MSQNIITTAEIKDSNITTAKIADANVTTVKIADSNVTDAKIASGVDGAKLTNATVTDAKITALAASKLTGTINDSQHGNRGNGALHSVADGSNAGFMSAANFTKLSGITTGAKYIYFCTVCFEQAGIVGSTVVSGSVALKTGITSGGAVTHILIPTLFPAGITVIGISMLGQLGFNSAGNCRASLDNASTSGPIVLGTSDDVWTMNLTFSAGSGSLDYSAIWTFIGIQ